jgi:carboxymethylenebutenolidase
VGDIAGAMHYLRSLPYLNSKVGVFGTCSGGRHAMLAASLVPNGFDAVVDCWGGGVVMAESDLTANRPVAPIDYTAQLQAPILGLFGDQDRSPTPEQVAIHEAELKKQGKAYEFHMYADAGHGFFYYDRPNYRQAQTVDGWQKIWAFLGKHLA